MKIVIAGAGAMGSTYASMLSKKNEVVLLDMWQDNIDEINRIGVNLNNLGNEEVYDIKAYKPKEYKGEADLLIVFTKSMQLPQMLDSVKHLLGENTHVLCLLNGLGHIDTLKKYVKEDKIIMGVTVLTAGMHGPGKFSVSSYGMTEIQNISKEGEKFAREFAENLDSCGLPCVYSEDIMYSIWRKACINGTMNSVCTILDCNMNDLSKVKNIKSMIKGIISEFSDVAKKEGVKIDKKKMTDFVMWYTTDEFQGRFHYPSMHQDLIQNHRKTEIDYLNGYVSRKGKEYGINTPYCDTVTIIIHGRENMLVK